MKTEVRPAVFERDCQMLQNLVEWDGHIIYNYGESRTRKIDLLPRESYHKVEDFVEQLIALNKQAVKEKAFQEFMQKMEAAEKSVQEKGFIRKRRLRRSWGIIARETLGYWGDN